MEEEGQLLTGSASDSRAFQNHMLMERFSMVVEFLNQKLGEGWTGGAVLEKPQQLLDVLRDGTALCRMVGVKPSLESQGSVENLQNFRKACLKIGLSEQSIFSVQDILSPSSLSCICVVNCLQELRLKLIEMDRALLNEHYSPTGGSGKKMIGSPLRISSPVVSRTPVGSRGPGGKAFAQVHESSPLVSHSKGILDILPLQQHQQVQTPHRAVVEDEYNATHPPSTPPTPPNNNKGSLRTAPGSSGGRNRSRRVSINTLNAQASIARVQERMASTYKDRCRQLEAGNKELLESVEELQRTIGNLQRSKHEYQLDCEKLQDRNRLLLSNFRVMEAQIMACVEAWQASKPKFEGVEGTNQLDDQILALQETWSDIVEEKAVNKQLTEGNNSEYDTDMDSDEGEESETVHPEKPAASATIEETEEGKESNARDEKNQEGVRRKSKGEMTKTAEELALQADELNRTKEILAQTKEHLAIREKELDQERTVRRLLESSVMEQLSVLKFEFGDLSNDLRSSFHESASHFGTWAKDLQKRVKVQELAHQELLKKFQQETKRRKQLLNTVHNLKGNIRVMCRIRPVLSSDLSKNDSQVAVESLSEERLALSVTATSATGTEHTKVSEFEFDRVFGATSTQQSVFDEVQPLVESVMDGYHSCIFAYGQTGSGKTYTMSGDGGENRGINFLALEELFRIYDHRKSSGIKYSFHVKNVEIYCEKVIDLLATGDGEDTESDTPNYLDIRVSERDGVHMPGCVETPVANAEEVYQVMALGAKNRSSAHTKMNMESSRSHSVVMVTVKGEDPVSGKITNGQLVLVDLAGSERLSKSGVEGVQLKEAQAINKSLSCLGDVIAALESKAPHVPFRNSKLTTLLQESLGKDNKALMILQVSPTLYNAQETLCSLNFAARVRQCELGKAKKKERMGESQKSRAQMKQATERIQQLEQKVRKLKKQLEEANEASEKMREENSREVEKATKKLQDKFQNLSQNEQMEIKALREKLAARDKVDNGKVAGLEKELHEAKMEISNLKQQLRSAISSATRSMSVAPTSTSSSSPRVASAASSRVSASTPGPSKPASRVVAGTVKPRTTKPSSTKVLQERRTSLDNIEAGDEKTPDKVPSNNSINNNKKQVSWKNTPQVIPVSLRKQDRENGDSEELLNPSDDTCMSDVDQGEGDNDTASQGSAGNRSNSSGPKRSVPVAKTTLHKRRTAASRAKAMGSASRVLQTPAKKPSARVTARRIPAAATNTTVTPANNNSNNTTGGSSRPVWQ